MQKIVNLVNLVKSFPTHIMLQNLASMEKRTSPVKFAHLVEKSGKGSISNLSTKVEREPSADVAVLRPPLGRDGYGRGLQGFGPGRPLQPFREQP